MSKLTKNYSPFPLFLAAAVYIMASPVFWSGVEGQDHVQANLIRGNMDLFTEVIPTIQYGFSRLRQGELPLWNDRQMCGTPFFANPAHGLFQPVNMVFLFFDIPRALALHAFISLSLMGIFFTLFMRSLGVLYIPATLGGIVYICCGASAAAMSRPAVANALVWMPLLLWAVRIYLKQPRLVSVIVGSIVLALLWLSGSPMMALVITVFIGFYAVCAVLFDKSVNRGLLSGRSRNQIRTIAGLLTMLIIAAGITSIQWLPALYWGRTLANPSAYFGKFTVPGIMPEDIRSLLLQFIQVQSGDLPVLGYIGTSTLLLLPVAFLHNLPQWERAFFAVASLTIVVAAVINGTGLPEGMTAPLVYPASFSVAVLAALGSDRLFAPRRNTSSPRLWGPLLLVTVVFLVLFMIAPAPVRGRMIPFAFALFIFALFRTRWAGVLSGSVLLLFLFVDLNAASANLSGHPFFQKNSDLALSERIKNTPGNALRDRRIYFSGLPAEDVCLKLGMEDGLHTVNGSTLLMTTDQRNWWDAMADGEGIDVSSDSKYAFLLNLMAVRFVISSVEGGLADGFAPGLRLRKVEQTDTHIMYENENALSRFVWAPSWRISADMDAALEVIGNKSFDPHRECVVMSDVSDVSHLIRTVPDSDVSSESNPAEVHITPLQNFPEKVVVELESTQPGVLVLADSYDQEWRATVNGSQVPIMKTNGLFRGIALPAGKHTVDFEYRPISFICGAVISASTLIFLLILFFLSFTMTFRDNKSSSNLPI